MTRAHQLAATLRSLGLSGMLDTLDARLAQAHGGDLGHLELLQALCEDEIARRDAAALVRRAHAARFERTVTLEEYDFSLDPGVPAAVIRDLATLRFLEAGESVILHGPVGVGKTMVAQALGHAACRRGHAVLFTKTSRLLGDLAGGHADRTFERRLRVWARPPLLILDDFAMRELTAAQADDLYELVTERAGRSLVITANRAASDWYPLFPNPVVAESILDRVVNSASTACSGTAAATGRCADPAIARRRTPRDPRGADGDDHLCPSRLWPGPRPQGTGPPAALLLGRLPSAGPPQGSGTPPDRRDRRHRR